MEFYPTLQFIRHPRDEVHIRGGPGRPRKARVVPTPGVPPFRIGEIEPFWKIKDWDYTTVTGGS